MRKISQVWLAAAMAVLAAAGLVAQDDALTQKARGIHERVMTLDTHDDISPTNFTAECNYTRDLGNQVNLPKMIKGGMDAAFFVVYVGQDTGPDAFTPAGYERAYKSAIEKFDAIHRLTEQIAPDTIGLALTSADARKIYASGRKVAFIGVENGYPIGEDLGRVKEFHDRGARYMSLAHNGHSQLSDSNTGERDGWKWNGLSPLGKQVIGEMNRVGIMIDVSHPSKASMMQALALTKAPIIASHSSVRKLADVSRNLDDEQLLALKKNGGVMQTVAFSGYVKVATDSPERTQALDDLRKTFGLPAGTPLGGGGGGRGVRGAPGGPENPCAGGRGARGAPAAAGGQGRGGGRGNAPTSLTDEQRADLQAKLADVNVKLPAPPRATVKDFVDHIDYAVKLIGIDHVGISSDFDGGGGVDGWNGADETFNVTLELVRRGYTEPQIAKLWSGNLLRVLDEVQALAKKLQQAKSEVGGGRPEVGIGATPAGIPTSDLQRRRVCGNRLRVVTVYSLQCSHMADVYLGELEQIVLLAVLRLGAEAYAVPILEQVEAQTGRKIARGALYTALDRLEKKGCLRSRVGEPLPERGGRARRYFTVTPAAVRALKASRLALMRLWNGLESLL